MEEKTLTYRMPGKRVPLRPGGYTVPAEAVDPRGYTVSFEGKTYAVFPEDGRSVTTVSFTYNEDEERIEATVTEVDFERDD